MSRVSPEVTKLRRRVVLAVVRREPGSTIADVHRQLCELRAQGQWPTMPNPGAQNNPYSGQVRTLLQALVNDGLLVQYVGPDGWTRCFATPADHTARANALLPQGDEAKRLLRQARDFHRQTGMELGFGVTHDLQRVVRVATDRGNVDYPVLDAEDYPWDEAIQDAFDMLVVAACA